MTITITELHGDGIGPELAAAVHDIAELLPLDLAFEPVDWSLQRRERDGDAAIDEAEQALRRTRLGLKYPTVTQSRSPNALIRRRLGLSVIHRPTISIEGIASNFREPLNLHIVRIATGGTYDDPGQPIGPDAAVSLRTVEREPCRQAAHFAFELARREGMGVTSASKHTIQRVTDGLFESTVAAVHRAGYSDVDHRSELFDALLGRIILQPQDYGVVLTLNEYGDFLSDMASGLVGSLGTGASGNFSFDADHDVEVAMFDPAGGTAPDIAGQDRCNPSAILFALGMLLEHIRQRESARALDLAVRGAIEAGETTADLGGALGTRAFTRAVGARLRDRLSGR